MKDIENRKDIDVLMRDFYGRLLSDPSIGYVFTDVAKNLSSTYHPEYRYLFLMQESTVALHLFSEIIIFSIQYLML